MGILGFLGLGSSKLAEENCFTTGTVTNVSTLYWLKINTRPARSYGMDGARFPHCIKFSYTVNGTEYHGSRYFSWDVRCPEKNEKIKVYYDKNKPNKYAILN